MTGIDTTHEKTIRVAVTQVGQDKTYIDVEDAAALLKAVGGTGRKVTIGGREVTKSTRLKPDDRVFVAPRAVKQG